MRSARVRELWNLGWVGALTAVGFASVYTARQNEVLGAWALFDDDPMPVRAKTIEETRLLRIGRDDFYDLLSDNIEITASIFSTLVKRFRKLVEQS